MVSTHTCLVLLSSAVFMLTLTATAKASPTDTVLIRTFSVDPHLHHLIFNDDLMFTSPVTSLLECSTLCSITECCSSFTFWRQDSRSECRGHSSRKLTPGQGQTAVRGRTFLWNHPDGKTGVPDGTLTNVALGKAASQGSNYSPYIWTANKAVDGNSSPNLFYENTCAHTSESGVGNWWMVDLAAFYDIYSVRVTNRGDCCSGRLRNLDIRVYTDHPQAQGAQFQTCYYHQGAIGSGATVDMPCCYGPITGRYVFIQNAAGSALSMCEVQVMAA